MEKTKPTHTKGPWTIDSEDTQDPDIMGGGCWIATCHSGYDSDVADARLIAAAPDLLEAAKYVIEYMGSKSTNLDPLRAAIRKAETKNNPGADFASRIEIGKGTKGK